VVAEVGFILAVAKFALPDFALSGGVHPVFALSHHHVLK
jgi:hypothetical protein